MISVRSSSSVEPGFQEQLVLLPLRDQLAWQMHRNRKPSRGFSVSSLWETGSEEAAWPGCPSRSGCLGSAGAQSRVHGSGAVSHALRSGLQFSALELPRVPEGKGSVLWLRRGASQYTWGGGAWPRLHQDRC